MDSLEIGLHIFLSIGLVFCFCLGIHWILKDSAKSKAQAKLWREKWPTVYDEHVDSLLRPASEGDVAEELLRAASESVSIDGRGSEELLRPAVDFDRSPGSSDDQSH